MARIRKIKKITRANRAVLRDFRFDLQETRFKISEMQDRVKDSDQIAKLETIINLTASVEDEIEEFVGAL